ncbi:preprotein translocase subunit SecG [Clostridium uliginosum]|uniref:Protein-export membrane protein SecG n=1 Tax=Clostridium uliginosum TaxID=119641 RepID=A0A1I1NB39_9CLOT|nr:preprotein translocase subunit SecG [Clostridium uliginosum]SFC94767.1 preprotein translocase subunit SecG [Clostridium uliginosum]
MQNILMGLEVILGLAIIVTIFMQPSKADALSGLIQGGSKDTFFSKNKSRTKEVMLVRITWIFTGLFAINTTILHFIK